MNMKRRRIKAGDKVSSNVLNYFSGCIGTAVKPARMQTSAYFTRWVIRLDDNRIIILSEEHLDLVESEQ